MGTSPSGPFDADLFSDVDRWIEVVVGAVVLTPRQILGSVPWALVAQQANEIVLDPTAARFEDCGDGTVADHQTGLEWEKKTGTLGTPVDCQSGCPDPHDVNNLYQWSINSGDPLEGQNGSAFQNFRARLNGEAGFAHCFADRCDWRVPKISELQTILIGPDAAPGQAPTCSAAPCIDPDFAAVGGPTASTWHVSAAALEGTGLPVVKVIADFDNGTVLSGVANVLLSARAVRTGSCH
jgi:hypothetical protein